MKEAAGGADEYGATSLFGCSLTELTTGGTRKRPASAVGEMAVGDVGEPETAGSRQPRGTDQSINTRPRRHANACHRANWSGGYELSKKLHGEPNSTALRGTPILIGPPQREQFQV